MTAPKVVIKKGSMGRKAFQSLGTLEEALKKGPAFPMVILMSSLLYFVSLCLSGLAANPKMSHGLFERGIANVSETHPLNITPAGWTFSIWGIIYLSQIASVLYSLSLLCRVTENGPAYLNPPILSPLFFVLFSLSSIFVSIWLFMWDRLMFISSSVFLLCCVICLWTAFSIASERLSFYRSELIDSGRSTDVSVILISVVNGLGMYATWSVIATLLNAGTSVVYKPGHPLSNETASIICLSFVAVFLVLYSCLDMIVCEHTNRFIFTPYLTIIWAMSGVLNKNWDPSNVSSIMSVVLLGCGAVALVVKIVLSACLQKSVNNPYRRMKMAIPMN